MNEESKELRQQLENKSEEHRVLKHKYNRVVSHKKKKLRPNGKCVYVGNNPLDKVSFKVGITDRVNDREATLSCSTSRDFNMSRVWYTRFNKQIEDAVKMNFDPERITRRKEHYNIEIYEDICEYITQLVKIFNDTDRHPEVIKKRKTRVHNPNLLSQKPCSVCKKILHLENFFNAPEHVDGKENTCKECVKERQKKYVEEKKKREEIPTEKACTQCKKVFALTGFYKDKSKFDGVGTKCKECFKAVQKRDNKPRVDVTEYNCIKCLVTKPINNFHKLSRNKTGHKYTCKECVLQKAKERYDKRTSKENRRKIDGWKCKKITCECGTKISESNIKKHRKTKKHMRLLGELV